MYANRREISDFVDACKDKKSPLADAKDGLAALEMAEAALISYREGFHVSMYRSARFDHSWP